ncbi:MAG TPA: SMP-30/gluconolactonase/LRE family protein [Pelomicrobium sp.]|nr:SMP-30/gluconolactonase/LRE family protein [Pelomicrobium sp.]
MRRTRATGTALLLVVAALTGCAKDIPRGELRYGVNAEPEGERMLWPQPPEVPRYAFAGELTGEKNFHRPDDAGKGAGALFRALVGLDAEPENPVVLQRPVSGVVDGEGRVYVTDVSRQAVFVFDPKAGELQVWDQAAGLVRLVAPSGIALGANGEVLVADAELGYVVRIGRDGSALGAIGKEVLTRPTGVARDPRRGLLYVADTYAHDVKAFDDEGRLVQIIGRRGTALGEFNFPTHLAFSNDELYVTDTMNNRVQVITAGGEGATRSLGTRGLFIGNLVRPKGVAVDGDGNIYVVESYFDTLLVYNPRGELLMPLGGSGTGTGRFYLPAGVWIDQDNRVFVADMFNGRVAVFQFLGGG